MKKLFILCLLFFLSACSPKTITNLKQEDINQIIFAIDSHEYQIREDKFEEIYSVLQEEYESKEEIEGIDKKHRVILNDEREEVFYIQNNGTIIKQEDRYYQYTFEKDSLLNLYKKILGNDIFYGEIVPNKYYVENIEENDVIFSIDPDEVLEIIVGSYGKSFLLKQDKISEFIHLLNQCTYYEVSDGGFYGVAPTVNLHFKDRHYWFQFMGLENHSMISFSTEEHLETNEYYKFITLSLKNDNLYQLLKDIMGEQSLEFDNFVHTPSIEWVEIIEEGKTINEVVCERSTLDICEFE